MRPNSTSALLKLHATIFLLGFTAILGKLITIEAIPLVWYRVFIAVVLLAIYLPLTNAKLAIPPIQMLKIAGIGLLVAAHWIFFFHAIKVSNVAVTLGVLSSGALFTSFLEPLILRRKIIWVEVLIGIVIIIGLYLIFQFETHYLSGIIFALLATVLAAFFTIFNGMIIKQTSAQVATFYEMLGGLIGITVFLLIAPNQSFPDFQLSLSDWTCLLLLGGVCTAFAFIVAIDVMKQVSAYTVVLSFNMEPIYGILVAFFYFEESEKMTGGFYLGAVVILAAVFLYPVLRRKFTPTAAR